MLKCAHKVMGLVQFLLHPPSGLGTATKLVACKLIDLQLAYCQRCLLLYLAGRPYRDYDSQQKKLRMVTIDYTELGGTGGAGGLLHRSSTLLWAGYGTVQTHGRRRLGLRHCTSDSWNTWKSAVPTGHATNVT